MNDLKPNTIAFWLLVMAVIMTMVLFAESRLDPSLRIAMLVSATGTVAGILAIASTLLTGKDVTKKATDDLPPNSTLNSSQSLTVKTPPEASDSTEAPK